MKKLSLSVNLSNDKKAVNAHLTDFVYNYDSNKQITKTSRKRIANYQLNTSNIVNQYCNDLTDTATAYCYHIAPKLVYTALNTVYQNTSNAFIFNLMCDTLDIMDKLDNNRNSMIDYISEKNNGENAIQEQKTHKYRIVNHKRIEIIPYTTLELTSFGKELLQNDELAKYNPCTNAQDLIQVAVLAIMELVNVGLVNNFVDVWKYSNYIYKMINKSIYSQRAKEIKSSESFDKMLLVFGDDDESRLIFGCKKVDSFLNQFNKKDVIQATCRIVYNVLPTKSNRINIVKSAYYYYYADKTMQEISDILNVSKMQISKYISTFEKYANLSCKAELLTMLLD